MSLDDRNDAERAEQANVSLAAVQLLRSTEVVDLHVESFIPPRLFGYDLQRRHGLGPLGGRFFYHLDFPRALEGGLTGAMWSISTNVLQPKRRRLGVLQRNVRRLRAAMERTHGAIIPVRTYKAFLEARARGAHGAMLAVQGGNAYDRAQGPVGALTDDWITRVTVVHLTNSQYGWTSSPAHRLRLPSFRARLTPAGRLLVERLNHDRIFVDLAHISRDGFWSALDVHDRSQPVIVTHTGLSAVTPHWRNLTDAQVRAVADTGGVVGIMFQTAFLKRRGGPRDARMVVEHLRHLVNVAGEDAPAIGSDYDGAIVPPRDLRDGAVGYLRLVQTMLDAKFSERLIQKILGENFLRTFAALRPG